MRICDYSFLPGLPLSEGLASLLAFLKSLAGPPLQKAASEGELQEKFHLTAGDSAIEEGQELSLAFSAYKKALKEGGEPFLLIPCLILDSICIENLPLKDGILRGKELIARSGLLMDWALPLEECAHQYGYFLHRAFTRSRAHWEEGGNDYLPFIEMFLALVYLSASKHGPARKPPKGQASGRKPTKRALIENFVLESRTAVSKAEICAALPQVSPTTVEAVLGGMVREGTILRIGIGRGTRYLSAAHSFPSQQ